MHTSTHSTHILPVIASLLISVGVFTHTAHAAPTYTSCTKYVSPSGLVNGNTAYTTIQAGVNALVSGDTLCVASGMYHESVAVKKSGTALSPITIRALDATQKPVIDGQYLIPGGPAAGGGAQYCQEYSVNPNANLGPYPLNACKANPTMQGANLLTIEASHIVWDGINVTRSRGQGVIIGNASGGGWYVTPVSNPAQGTWYYDIKFLNSNVTHVREMGVFILYADGVVFSGNTIRDSNNFASYNRWEGVNSGEANYGWLAWAHDLSVVGKNIVISDNTFAQSFGEGIQLARFTILEGIYRTVENVVIKNNIFYDHWSSNLYVGGVDNLRVEGNVIYSSGDSTFFPNYKGHVSTGGCLVIGSERGLPGAKNAVFVNNIISGCDILVRLAQYESSSTYSNISFYNNTLINPYKDGGLLANHMTRLSGFTFMNNIAFAPKGSIFSSWHGFNTMPDMKVGNNLWSAAPTPRFSLGSGSTYTQANLSGPGDIITTNPGLANPTYQPVTGGSFDANSIKLITGSPAINTGTNVTGVTTDYFGATRPSGYAFDIGAYESSSTQGVTCTNTLTSSTVVPTGFGASYNLFSTAKEYFVSSVCSGSTATLTVGNNDPLTYAYKTGYYHDGTNWLPYNLTCSGQTVSSVWCVGKGTASVPLPQNPQNIIGYTCQYTSGAWKCGCRDNACTTPYWQLQRVGK